jgi:Cof subfamily protein (haloacid dehalogenase superfamily)
MPSCRPKLVATDLDGTLLHSDGTVTDRTREVLDALDARGVTVVFVTGRPIRWMDALWDHVGDLGLAICSNGGIVYDVPGRSVAEARTIPRHIGLKVADLVRTAIPGSLFALEKTAGFGKEPTFLPSPEDADNPELTVGPLEEIFDDSVVKLLALHLEMAPDEYWAQVEQLVGHSVTTTWSSVGSLVEMSGAGVTKASTLQLICAERGIAAEDVVAFGDMPNDIPMLEWAGTSYAMANGHPTAIAAADHVAPRNDQDGVAQVLEELFLS